MFRTVRIVLLHNSRQSQKLAAALLAGALLAGSAQAEIPDLLYCPQIYNDSPAFAAVEQIVTEGGEVNSELLGLERAKALKELALGLPVIRDDSLVLKPHLQEKTGAGPVVIELRDSGLQGHFFSLDKGLDEAHIVLKGRVVSTRQGFANRRLGQMVELEVEQVLKGQVEGKNLLFFFPGGRIDLWGVSLQIQYEEPGAEPAAGDEVILFYKNYARNRHCPFVTALPAGILTFRGGVAERLPRIYRGADKDVPWTLETTLRVARTTLASPMVGSAQTIRAFMSSSSGSTEIKMEYPNIGSSAEPTARASWPSTSSIGTTVAVTLMGMSSNTYPWP